MRTSDLDLSVTFESNPLAWLLQARQSGQALVPIREHGAVFTPRDEATRSVAVFGAELIRHVLTSPATFVMPESATRRLGLPPSLSRLSRSLHSLSGEDHSEQRRLLGAVLGAGRLDEQVAHATMDACVKRWETGPAQSLLARMRELCICLASQHLLGADPAPELPDLLFRYFYLRRQASSPAYASLPRVKEDLLVTGRRLDRILRRHLRRRTDGANRSVGVLDGLLDPAGANLSEDDAVGHASILFVSAVEPVAAALTWTLLILSQAPVWRDRVRGNAATLEHVLLESLRLLPPNTFMSRVAIHDTVLGGVALPARTEILISPFLEHRDGAVFATPDVFVPERWREARPGAFEFMPFGAGAHSCIGRSMGMDLLRTALAYLTRRFDIVLCADHEVDWHVSTVLLPRQEIPVRFAPAGTSLQAGRWSGPVAEMVTLP